MSDGIVFGNYFLLGRLAAGGMAEVFLGKRLPPDEDEQLLAIKKMLPRLSEDPNFVSMFIDEARIAGGLSHPNICKITDQGQHDGQLFIAMEFIHGKDLRVLKRRARKRGETIPSRIVAYTIATIAEALDFAHNKCNDQGNPENIVHRDVSPQNILLSYDGTPKLIDFGVAKAKHRLAQTRVGVVKGKFAYMSPEQATGQELDARTDIFALGVVLYELLTGRLPFKGGSDLSTLKRIARAEYIPPAEINEKIPSRMGAIIERALQRDPAARYPTAAALASDLHRHLADERREVTDTVLSSYLRRLFRDDYIREMARIKSFREISLPPDATAHSRQATDPEAPRHSDPTQPGTNPEPTTVSASQFLAAGYDDGPPSAEGPLDEDVRDTSPQSKRLQVDDAIDLLDAELNGFHEGTEHQVDPEALRADDGDWDSGPTTDRERPVPAPMATDLTPVADPDELTGTQPGLEDNDFSPSFDGKTVEFRFSEEEAERLLAATADGPDGQSEVAPDEGTGQTTLDEELPETLEAEDDFDIDVDEPIPASEPLPDVRETPPPPPPRPRSRRLLTNEEIALLFLAAALGLALVVGVYVYATTLPVPTQPSPPTVVAPETR